MCTRIRARSAADFFGGQSTTRIAFWAINDCLSQGHQQGIDRMIALRKRSARESGKENNKVRRCLSTTSYP